MAPAVGEGDEADTRSVYVQNATTPPATMLVSCVCVRVRLCAGAIWLPRLETKAEAIDEADARGAHEKKPMTPPAVSTHPSGGGGKGKPAAERPGGRAPAPLFTWLCWLLLFVTIAPFLLIVDIEVVDHASALGVRRAMATAQSSLRVRGSVRVVP